MNQKPIEPLADDVGILFVQFSQRPDPTHTIQELLQAIHVDLPRVVITVDTPDGLPMQQVAFEGTLEDLQHISWAFIVNPSFEVADIGVER